MNVVSIPAEWLPHYTYTDYKRWEGDWELIHGFPYAMSPSPLYKHQRIGSQFVFLVTAQLQDKENTCNCQAVYEVDWIINELTIVRPDVMIICDFFPTDFVRTPPVLILEIASEATRLKDRNLKFKLYEESGVKYYLIADPDSNRLEIFMLKNNRYAEVDSTAFALTPSCTIEPDLQKLWQ